MGRYRRQLIGAAVVAVLVSVYAIAGFWAAPYFVRSNLIDYVRTRYGRTLRIGEVRCNPFTLRAEVRDLSLPDRDGEPLVAFRRLSVDLQLATLWRLAPSFRAITLEAPYVRAVIRADGALNLGDLAQGAPAPATAAAPSRPLRLYIARLTVRDGRSSFEDRTRATAFRADFTPVSFELRDFSTVAGNGNAYRLSAASPQRERLDWQGTFTLDPFTSRGAFEIRDLKARTLWEYLRASVPFEIGAGVLALRGDYSLDSGRGPLAVQLLVHQTTLDGFTLRPKGEPDDYVQLQHLELSEAQVDLVHRHVELARVRLAGGRVSAWLDGQGVNLLRLAPAAREVGPAPVAVVHAAPAPQPWTIAAPDIDLDGLTFAAADRTVTPAVEVQITPLHLTVGGFSTRAGATLRFDCAAPLAGGGLVSVQGQLVPSTASGTAHVHASELALTRLQPYLARYTSMTLRSGALGAEFDLERGADGALSARGQARIAKLHTVDNSQRRDFVSWGELALTGIEYRSRPQSLRVKSVLLRQPYARMIIRPDQTLNLTEVLTPAGRTASPATAQAVPPAARSAPAAHARPPAANAAPVTPFPVAIGTVRLADATLDYTDLWIKPSFAIGIQSLHGTVSGLSSDPRSRARVELDGKVERYSPAHIGGELNVLSAALYSDITMSFKDIDLTIVNPYAGHFVGYRIDKGKLSVDVSYRIEQRQLQAKQHFVVDQLELGDRVESPDAIHVPLKLAVALLKDRQGVIDVELPMAGTLDDPHFRLGPLIWKALVNLLVKAATAPFALLGHLFGGSEHMNVVEFAPGSAALDAAAQQQLSAVARALRERPQLKLDVPIVAAPPLDGPPLAAALLERQLRERVRAAHKGSAAATVPTEPAQRYRLLLAQYRESLGKDAPLPAAVQAVESAGRKETPPYELANEALTTALLAHAPAGDAELTTLGKARARAIQEALLAGGEIAPARVFIVATAPDAGAGPKVQVELALK
ncbi:MAG: DUF748 domain-containing protein [Gammaproteobacteria bacterium]|nr:DUF748 domain-containing protein [Gammaproteobacteria bacterium]